jgi:hypothetical protein
VWSNEGALSDAENQIVELMQAYRQKKLSASIVFPEVQRLEEDCATLRQQRTAWVKDQVMQEAQTTAYSWEEFTGLGLLDRRAYIEAALHTVIIQPSVGGPGSMFDPGRVEPVLRAAAA